MRGTDHSTEVVLKREDALRTIWKILKEMWVCPRCFLQIWQLGNGYPWLSGLSATHQQTPHDVYHLFNHLGPCVWAPLPLLGSKFGHSQVCGVSMNWPLSSVMAKHSRWSCFPWLWRGSCWSLPAPVSLWLGFNSFWPLKQLQPNLDKLGFWGENPGWFQLHFGIFRYFRGCHPICLYLAGATADSLPVVGCDGRRPEPRETVQGILHPKVTMFLLHQWSSTSWHRWDIDVRPEVRLWSCQNLVCSGGWWRQWRFNTFWEIRPSRANQLA